MTGRERVTRCLEMDHPDRVPRDVWMLPIAQMTHGRAAVEAFHQRWPSDFDGAGMANSGLSRLCKGDPYQLGQFVDEWGCVFENIHAGVIGEVKQPILEDWARLADLRVPVEAYDIDVQQVNAQCAASDRHVGAGCCPRPFERCQFLRGSEMLYMDLADPTPELLELIRIVHQHYCKELESWVRTKVDRVQFMDDWGSQRALLISPQQWREIFKPLYADYVRIAHNAGKKIFMHSDGCIFDIYEDLIELGIDAVNSQLFCMNIEQIGRRFKGRITFWGEIDRQHILTEGTPEDCRAAVRRVASALWDPAGGVIGQFEMATAPLANYDAVFEAWNAVGR
jgi:hypothetical protein